MPVARVGHDIELAYETFGDAGDPTLVLIAGLGSQLLMWDEELCWGFVDRGFHVVRFDNRDAGLSTRPPPDATYDLSDMAADVVGLLDALGVAAAHVMGMSLGGMIAQTLAIEHRQRVLSLTSISSTTGHPDHGRPTDEVVSLLRRPEPADPAAAIDAAVEARRAWASPLWFDEAGTRRYYERQYARAPAANSARQFDAIVRSGDREAGLATVEAPTLVVHGTVDPMIALSGGRRTASVIPGAELVVVDGMGHDLPVQVWPQLIERVTGLAARLGAG